MPLPVRRYLDLMNARQVAAREVLSGTDIDIAALADPTYMIEFEQYRRLLENLTRHRDDAGFGLDAGLGVSFTDLGPLGYAAMFCRSARHSMEVFWPRYGEMFGLMGKPVSAPTAGAIRPSTS